MISAIDFNESVSTMISKPNYTLFYEAVFTDGKKSLKPIVDQFQVLKDILEKELQEHRESVKDANDAVKKSKMGEIVGKVRLKRFDPEKFWRNTEWKKLEDIIQKQFGLRVCKINTYNEKYDSSNDVFESKELNAYVYRRTRYPVEGLITEKGFYDKSHSLDLDMYISLGLLRYLSAAEIVAVMLHEFGHSIDPALCDIKYTGTNVLCKYITDRKGSINKEEQKLIDSRKDIGETKGMVILPFLSVIGSKISDGAKSAVNGVKRLFSAIGSWFTRKGKKDKEESNVNESVLDIFRGADKRQEIKLKKLQAAMEKETIEFSRKEFSEAFADNFARMYGYGVEMASALKKLSKDVDKKISRIEKERKREEAIYAITEAAIKDVHKTDVHRVKALIKEYYEDIEDPNTPPEVKKQLQADVKEVETVLEQFMNEFSEFQNRVNKLISDEIDKMDAPEDEVKKESIEYTSESYYDSETGEELYDFDEKSHGKLKFDFRYARNSFNDKLIKIVYELNKNMEEDPNKADNHTDIKYGDKKANYHDISKYGNKDHDTNGEKVLAIIEYDNDSYVNMRDADLIKQGKGRKLQKVDCYGIFSDSSKRSFHIEVGKYDREYSYKSTYVPKKHEIGSIANLISRHENRPIQRGEKASNFLNSYNSEKRNKSILNNAIIGYEKLLKRANELKTILENSKNKLEKINSNPSVHPSMKDDKEKIDKMIRNADFIIDTVNSQIRKIKKNFDIDKSFKDYKQYRPGINEILDERFNELKSILIKYNIGSVNESTSEIIIDGYVYIIEDTEDWDESVDIFSEY